LTQDLLVKRSHKIYQKHARFLKFLQHARFLTNDTELLLVERLHEVICSLHLLRFHFAEFALFEVCFQEMQNLQKTSQSLLEQLKKQITSPNAALDDSEFINAIHYFENLYSNTLQVVARDSQVFLFFMQDLYVLRNLAVDKA
jgi:hypothetical protein